MEIVTSINDVEQIIQNRDMVLIYFSGKNCGVCSVLKPKVNELTNEYPNIKKIEVEVENSLHLSAQYNLFTVPAVLLFIEGKEAIRELRHISMLDLETKISRYYKLFY
ncbi:thioredoxin family protein [Haloplasma contractile]|uniref:Thioredoxin reductase protein n=1 Tax=Haloplasma contractile SSD-17B TaxID=1033810 RepID=F7Q0R9_9MOLU|nr:thioredoxin family protein [Haloplasma contractile]ERJ11293.1 thioredoxin reductase protein [Haloplasma contractile SSD-17B]